jgi:hypothetical protein
MLPIQILLNNLLYDTSQTVMTTDNVDAEYIEKPKRWDISFIRRFMVTLGPVSSLFDFATFFIMLFIFLPMVPASAPAHTGEHLFQTAWFIESLCSQTLVVLIIRTRRVPFYKSKPSKYLTIMLLSVISFAIIVPYTPVGEFFGFVPPPPAFYLALAGILGVYAVLAETVKRWFYKHNAHRVEQVLVPKRKTIYFTKTAKFMQDMVAVISLRFEDEISIDSLTENLNSAITYPINPNQVIQNLQYLRRAGLISVDWQKRTIKREKPMKEYVRKNIVATETWPNIIEDWNKISDTIQGKYGKVNTEYQGMLNPKQN